MNSTRDITLEEEKRVVEVADQLDPAEDAEVTDHVHAKNQADVAEETDAPDTEPQEPPAPAILARELTLRTRKGPVFSDVDVEIPAGSIHTFVGPQGSGRTSLLLVLAGRMRYTSGKLHIHGKEAPNGTLSTAFGGLRHVQKITAIAGFRGIDDLDISTGVGEVVNERLGLITPIFRRAETLHAQRVQEILELTIPDVNPKTWVRNLSAFDDFATRIALALLDEPHTLLVDDVDQLTAPDDQRQAWDMLQRINEQLGVTVVASTTNEETLPHSIPVTEVARDTTKDIAEDTTEKEEQ